MKLFSTLSASLLSLCIPVLFLAFWVRTISNSNTSVQLRNNIPTVELDARTPLESKPDFCGFSSRWTAKVAQDSNLKAKDKYLEHLAYQYFSDPKRSLSLAKAQFTLPVVVHIIHENVEENISDERVERGIQYLNEAFANEGYYDQGEGVDVDIQFCLARRNPDGEVTTGINRVESPLTVVGNMDTELKDLIRWAPTCYINIWIVQEIGDGVAGYAYLPSSHGQDYDGIVCKAEWIGQNRVGTNVLMHEMGHYLGLYHTFEGGCTNDDCLEDGDRVCDTPPDQSTAPVPCSVGANTCDSDTDSGFTEDQSDMINNYMDYGDWNCYNAFTQGQKDRMHYFLTNVRQSLLDCPSCLDPCPTPIAVDIETTTDSVPIAGNLNVLSSSDNTDDLIWTINGQAAGTGTSLSFSATEIGTKEIILTGVNSDANCLAQTDTLLIEVYCPIQGTIQIEQPSVRIGQEVSILSSFENAEEVKWLINGEEVGTGEELITIFEEAGNYEIYAEASNGFCSYQSAPIFLFVNDNCNYDGTIYGMGLQNMGIAWWMQKAPDGGYFHLSSGGFSKLDENKSFEWGRGGNALFRDVEIDPADGSAILVGSYPQDVGGAFVTKMSAEGNTLWTKKIAEEQDSMPTRMYEIVPDNEGNYYLLGGVVQAAESSVEDGYGFLLKINADGDILFTKTFELMVLRKLVITSDNGCLLIGEYGDPDFAAFNLIKLDQQGNVDWSNMYIPESPPWLMVTDLDFELERVANQDYLMSFHTGYGDGDFLDFVPKPFFMKVNEGGDILWTKRYTFPDTIQFQEIEGLAQLPDGDVVFTIGTGGRNIDGYNFLNYARMDLNGDIQWTRRKPMVFPYTTDIFHLQEEEIAVLGALDNTNHSFFMDELGFSGECPIENGEIVVEPRSFVSFPFNLVHPSVDLRYDDTEAILVPILTWQNLSCSSGGITAFDGNLEMDSIRNCETGFNIQLTVCNWGNQSLHSSVPIALYAQNPTISPTSLLTATVPIGNDIPADSCATISIDLEITLPADSWIYAVINDDGSQITPYDFGADFPLTPDFECIFTNNLDSINTNFASQVRTSLGLSQDTIMCPGESLLILAPEDFHSYLWEDGTTDAIRSLDGPGEYWLSATNACGEILVDTIRIRESEEEKVELGPDQSVCSNQIFTFSTEGDFSSYRWQDGTTNPTFTAWQPGIYWLEAVDACGRISSDTVNVILNEATSFDLGNDTLLCTGQTISLAGEPGFMRYEWFPKENLSCDDCPSIIVQPDTTITYTLIAELEPGCISTDTIRIGVGEPTTEEHQISICEGTSALIFGEEENLAGLYSETFASQAGCDSTINILLTVVATIRTQEELQICEGETAEVFGQEESNEGIYSRTYTSAETGCDSIHTISLVVLDTMVVEEEISICGGQSIVIFGEERSSPGDFTATFTAQNGCDSTHIVHLSVVDTVKTFSNINICQGEQVEVFGTVVTTDQVLSNAYQSVAGCDSIHQVEVKVLDTLVTFANQSICAGESVELFGELQYLPGVYQATYTGENGCDSTHYIALEVFDTVSTFEALTICEGDSALIFEEFRSVTGTYSASFLSQNNCDSTHYVQLEVLATSFTTDEQIICAGDSVLIFDEYIQAEGVYEKVFMAANGCDSTHTITLFVVDTIRTSETQNICAGESTEVFGQMINTTGTFQSNFIAANGCDSLHQIEVVVLDTIATFAVQTICEGETAQLFGQAENVPGVYSETFNAENGCDSTHYITLEVLDTVSTREQINICPGDSVLIFGQIEHLPGSYTASFVGQNNCDSTHQIELSWLDSPQSQESVRICAGDSIQVFGRFVSEAGVYAQAFSAVNGCDSTHQITVAVGDPIVIEKYIQHTCFGQQTGSIELQVSGGLAPYTLSWENGETTLSRTNLLADSYYVTVQDQLGCIQVATIAVEEVAPPLYDLDWLDESCFGEQDGEINVVSLEQGLSYSLGGENFQSTGVFSGLSAGTYELVIRNEEGCSERVEVIISAPPETLLEVPERLDLIKGDTSLLLITGEIDSIVAVAWAPSSGLSCSDCLTPLIFARDPMVYEMKATDVNGCLITATVEVNVEEVPELDPPTAFSPNNDGVNDEFVIPGLERFPEAELVVVNRWGGVVYQAKPYQNDWNGQSLNNKPLTEGTYYYLLYLDIANGKMITGNIALIR